MVSKILEKKMSNEGLGFRVWGCSKWGNKALGEHGRVITL